MVTAIRPPRVRPGQTIGIAAPAGPVKPAATNQLHRGLDRLRMFDLRIAPSLTTPHAADVPSYLAASDDQRADELSAMLADPDVRGIVLARGGYGIQRILSRLDPDLLRRDPKPIVGFSDATALLAWAYAAGVRGIHGPMVVQLGNLPVGDAERLIALLTDPKPPAPWQLESEGRGIHRGHLVPANLTMVSLAVATPWPLPLTDAIGVFEEVGEKPYEIDRYLTHLILTGALRDTAAVVIGDLTRCTDPAPPTGEPDPADAAQRTIRERLTSAGKPHAFGAPIGHGDRNQAVPFGASCELDLDLGVLSLFDGAVS